MAVTVELVGQIIERIAPKWWAEDWDNVGLLVGDTAAPVERILLTLDGTLEIASEAKEFDAQLIVAHHPIMFKPLKNLRADNTAAQLPLLLWQHKIAYYAAHTNLDQSILSSSRALGDVLGLTDMKALAEPSEDRAYLPGQDRLGYGVIGYLPKPEKLGVVWKEFISCLEQLGACSLPENRSGARLAGDAEKMVRKVAIVNGSGTSFLSKALFKGADLLITGDVDHHTALEAMDIGVAIADLGHFWSEAPMMHALYHYLTAEKQLHNVEIRVSAKNRSPWADLE